MRILLDTNIIIHREDNKVIDENIQDLLRIISKLKISIVLHPKCIEDIKRDKDERRKDVILSKFKTYNCLDNYPDLTRDSDFLSIIGEPNKINDEIDNYLLYTIYKNAVNFLITEDSGIHKKARRLNLSDRVLKVIEALELFKKEIPIDVKLPPALKKSTMANLDLNDPIFNVLREDYLGFNNWYTEKAKTGRDAWVYYLNDNSLGAVLFYKTENEDVPSIPPLPKKERLKIASMVVTHVGYKIGELLLKKSILLSIKNDLSEIYLTHFTKDNDFLVNLIEEYGFIKTSVLKHDWTDIPEDVYLKQIIISKDVISDLAPFEISKLFYPNLYDGEKIKKFVIPIQPQYFERLFVDYPKRQTTLNEHVGEFIIEGNTIKKAYLSRSPTKKMEKGDLILFYRSQDFMSIVSLGVIESVYYDLDDPNEIRDLVGKRTVYKYSEIVEFTKAPTKTTVILFNHHFHFKKPIVKDVLINEEILKRIPQSITQIDHEKYLTIKQKGGIDERFTFD